MPAINGVAKPASPRCGRRSKTDEAKSQTDPLNSRIDGLLATVSLGAGYRRINRLPATPSIGVASHEFLLRAGNTSGHGDNGQRGQSASVTHASTRILKQGETFGCASDRKSTRLNSSHLGISYA